MDTMTTSPKIAIIGLGYVGLPLAIAFGQKYATVGFDTHTRRVDELKEGKDHTLQSSSEAILNASQLSFSVWTSRKSLQIKALHYTRSGLAGPIGSKRYPMGMDNLAISPLADKVQRTLVNLDSYLFSIERLINWKKPLQYSILAASIFN